MACIILQKKIISQDGEILRSDVKLIKIYRFKILKEQYSSFDTTGFNSTLTAIDLAIYGGYDVEISDTILFNGKPYSITSINKVAKGWVVLSLV